MYKIRTLIITSIIIFSAAISSSLSAQNVLDETDDVILPPSEEVFVESTDVVGPWRYISCRYVKNNWDLKPIDNPPQCTNTDYHLKLCIRSVASA